MKKLLIALILAIGIAVGGCVTTGPGGTSPDTTTLPRTEYIELDFFENGTIYYIPNHIRANEPIWAADYNELSDTIVLLNFTRRDEFCSFLCNVENDTILMVVYGKLGIEREYYIYDEKPYPTKVDKETAENYYNSFKPEETI